MKKQSSLNYIVLAWKSAPAEMFFKILSVIWQGVYPAGMVLAGGYLIDMGVLAAGGERKMAKIVPAILLFVGFMLANQIGKMFRGFVELQFEAVLTEKINVAVIEKKASVKYSKIEETSVQELFSRISDEPANPIKEGVNNLLDLFSFGFEMLAILAVLFLYAGWITLLICVCVVPILYIALKCGEYDYEVYGAVSEIERKNRYYQKMLLAKEQIEEREIFGYTECVNKRWEREQEKIVALTAKATAKISARIDFSSVLIILVQGLIMLLLLYPLEKNILTVGIYITILKEMNSLIQKLVWQAAQLTKDYETCRRYMEDYKKLLALEEEEALFSGSWKKEMLPKEAVSLESLRFEHVSFRYPGQSADTLKDINLCFEKGKKYALVGENGAGKTTLMKLVLGMYDSYEGTIFINERDIRTFSASERRACINVLFQDFFHYQIPVADYLSLGMEKCEKSGKPERVLESVGLMDKINSFRDGWNTTLGTLEGDGMDLSGGQWQKLAAARCLLRESAINILDEPTAALDPVSEKEFYDVIQLFAKNRITIMVTHRMGLALAADEIVVIREGSVCEKGSHMELLEKGGLYYSMYEAQKRWYHNEK